MLAACMKSAYVTSILTACRNFLAHCRAVLGNQKPGADVDGDSNKGIIIIGANCLIRMANDAAVQVSRTHAHYASTVIQS